MGRNKIKNGKMDYIFPLRMNKSFKDEFKNYCDDNGFSMAKRIRLIMFNDIENNEEII